MAARKGIKEILKEFYTRLKGKVSSSVTQGDTSPVCGGGVFSAIQAAKPEIVIDMVNGAAKTNVTATPVSWTIEQYKAGYTPISVSLVANNSADTLFGIEAQVMQSGYVCASGFVSKRANDGTLPSWQSSLVVVWMKN